MNHHSFTGIAVRLVATRSSALCYALCAHSQRKFYIEKDWTEEGVTRHLLEAGVPKEDIVLVFHAPEMRQFAKFAVM